MIKRTLTSILVWILQKVNSKYMEGLYQRSYTAGYIKGVSDTALQELRKQPKTTELRGAVLDAAEQLQTSWDKFDKRYWEDRQYQRTTKRTFTYLTPYGQFTDEQMSKQYHQWDEFKSNHYWRMENGILAITANETPMYNPRSESDTIKGGKPSVKKQGDHYDDALIGHLGQFASPPEIINLPDTEKIPFTDHQQPDTNDFGGGSGSGSGASGDFDPPSTDTIENSSDTSSTLE